jgi:hypothetical protein
MSCLYNVADSSGIWEFTDLEAVQVRKLDIEQDHTRP